MEKEDKYFDIAIGEGLELILEPHSLPEILTAVSDEVSSLISKVEIEARPPEAEQPVLVDYEYLKVGLKLLFEGIFQVKESDDVLRVRSLETETSWDLYIEAFLRSLEDIVGRPFTLEELVALHPTSELRVLRQGIVERQYNAAQDAEDDLDALFYQALTYYLGSRHFHIVSLPLSAEDRPGTG